MVLSGIRLEARVLREKNDTRETIRLMINSLKVAERTPQDKKSKADTKERNHRGSRRALRFFEIREAP